MNVNYFYDNSASKKYSNDDEGNLVQLCKACAQKISLETNNAAKGDADSECELCGATQED